RGAESVLQPRLRAHEFPGRFSYGKLLHSGRRCLRQRLSTHGSTEQEAGMKHVTPRPLANVLLAEALGSVLLAATVVGSGVMAQRLSAGNTAIALLANTGATVAGLAVLVGLLGPISG